MIGNKARRGAAILAAAIAAIFATSAARATDLESNCMFAAESGLNAKKSVMILFVESIPERNK